MEKSKKKTKEPMKIRNNTAVLIVMIVVLVVAIVGIICYYRNKVNGNDEKIYNEEYNKTSNVFDY